MSKFKNKLLCAFNRMHKALGPQHWWPGDTALEISVGAILTQNTSWSNVRKAIEGLKKHRILNPRALGAIKAEELAEHIRPAGYFNVKARRLKNFIFFLNMRYGGSMRSMLKEDASELRGELLDINGIGEETADSILLYALNKPVFVVDAYTRRILHRHAIAGDDDSYGALQKVFHDAFLRDEHGKKNASEFFNEYHALLVNIGKNYCRPKDPRCASCPLKGL